MATAKPKVPTPKDPLDESDKKGTESEPDASDAASDPPPVPKRSVKDRIKDIETRWGKGFEEIMIDLHDHVFGTSLSHEETTAKQEADAKAADPEKS